MILSVSLLTIGIVLLVVEARAVRKRTHYNKAIDFVLSKDYQTKGSSPIIDASILTIGSSATNIYDIYAACEEHEEVLDVIEYRFPNVMGDASPMDWFSKVTDLMNKPTRSLDAYHSAFIGQLGENQSLDYFSSQGLKAYLFEDRTHRATDVYTIDELGNKVEYSVKNFGKVDNFLAELREHPEVENWVVNSEIYDQLEESGRLDLLEQGGRDIIDGGFLHDEASDTITEALKDVSNAGDLADDIPFIALALFGVKTVKNIKLCSQHKQSYYETGVEIGMDAVRVGTAGVLAAAGANIGAAIGTSILPGVGTLVGGGLGALAGAVAGSSLIQYLKEKWKWGEIIKAIDYVGDCVLKKSYSLEYCMADIYRRMYDFESNLKREESIIEEKKLGINPYSNSPIMISSVLAHVHTMVLKAINKQCRSAAKQFHRKVIEVCASVAAKMAPDDRDKQKKIKQRLIGELICSNDHIFSRYLSSDPNYVPLTQAYTLQKGKSPNHPYRFSHDPQVIMQSLIIDVAFAAQKPVKVNIPKVNVLFLIISISLIAAAFYLFLL